MAPSVIRKETASGGELNYVRHDNNKALIDEWPFNDGIG